MNLELHPEDSPLRRELERITASYVYDKFFRDFEVRAFRGAGSGFLMMPVKPVSVDNFLDRPVEALSYKELLEHLFGDNRSLLSEKSKKYDLFLTGRTSSVVEGRATRFKRCPDRSQLGLVASKQKLPKTGTSNSS